MEIGLVSADLSSTDKSRMVKVNERSETKLRTLPIYACS